ncbi:MAG TPA: PDZ domain-containing protein [Vicinamibacterales bacterium]|nr:PDZ domain-containing protein [Vicinamibacterales bacterium]
MKNIKFGAFFLGLTLAVSGAVSLLSAQDRPAPQRLDRGNVMVLDGRGAQLGVMVSDVADAKTSGVRIDEVNPDSPAEKAGLREGDIVVEFDGERVRSARQFTRLVQETPDGRAVKIAVMRNGQKQVLDATPEAGRMTWNFGIDSDRLKEEIERGLREYPRAFPVEPPQFDFRYDDRGPRRFEYRLPEMVMPYMSGRARLGVSVQSLTPELEEYFGAKNGGVLVSSVAPDSAAAKAGVKAGDVITTINSRRVNDTGDLVQELRELSGEVTIGVVRDRKAMELKATLDKPQGLSPRSPRARSRPGVVL